jgi:adhesin/invasin
MIKHFFLKKPLRTLSFLPKRHVSHSPLPHIRRIVWGTLLLQLFFPLSAAFSPAIASIKASAGETISSDSSTEPYVLGFGETVDTVAKKYGITVDELKKINTYRTFSRPFIALTAGDELDVPHKAESFSIDNNQGNTRSVENKLASHAVAGATALSNGELAKSARQLARSAANSEFNSSAGQWLGQFGTSRVQLNFNDDFHLDGSAVDVLVPLYDNQASILFTQLGARNKDSRNTFNIGAGVRTFQGDWMYGMSTFFDNDVTGKNRRVGLGIEAWTDYLKLSGNSYFGTTDWHQSRDFADYNERPSTGYDVRAEAYLPAYPQLGGKLMYEQYQGDEVALFGKDDRQKNPHAMTVGINYTPVPLFTVGAEHQAGNGSHNDSRVNVQFNYLLGESWQSHIDPSGVAASRTLAGSRYDLVERNNNIVLDYQKQDLIRLTLPEQVTGESSSSVTVNAQVASKYGLERIEWESADLSAAGGSLVQVSPQAFSVTLPPYQATLSSNAYRLSAVAYDRQGTASSRTTMQIVVIPGNAELTAGNLTVTADDAIANGTATNAVQAVVTDAGHQPIVNQTVIFTASNGATVTTVIGTTETDGIATAMLTSTTAGISNVTASVNGSSQSVPITFIADSTTAQIADADFRVASGAVANGEATNALSATVKDANGNAVPNVDVTFAVTTGDATPGSQMVQTDADGVATATLVSLVAGDNAVTATVGSNTATAKTSSFIANSTTAQIADADFTVAGGAVANGEATNALSATVKDANGNAVPNVDVTFAVTTGDATPGSQTVQTDADGVATATLVSLVAGDNAVTATVGIYTTTTKTSTFIAVPAMTSVLVNDEEFTVNSNFPTTGFTGAKFTLTVPGTATDYTWSSSAPSWAPVDSYGNVSFTQKGNSSPVIIVASPRGGGTALTYTFTVGSWFTSIGLDKMSWSNASLFCASNGLEQPTRLQLTNVKTGRGTRQAGSGALWSEWGAIRSYTDSNFATGLYWASEAASVISSHYTVSLFSAIVANALDSDDRNVVCREAFGS